MTFAAILSLPEPDARSLLDALAEDEGLAERPVDLHETAPGRWEVVVYFEAEPGASDQESLAGAAVAVLGRNAPAFRIEALPETDWVRRSLQGLVPIRIGRFLVHGRHDRDRVRPNDVAIEIEAGEAFGTGHHGSTLGCLAAIDALARQRHRVRKALDVGTGTGILAIAIARGLKAPVLATDIDPVAAAVAAANAELNGAARMVTTVTAGGLSARIVSAHGPFDLVVANILAGPLVRLAPSIRRHLAARGSVVLSGLLPAQRARVAAAYRGQGLRLVRAATNAGWLTLVFERKSVRTAGMRGRPPRAPRAGGQKWRAKRRRGQ